MLTETDGGFVVTSPKRVVRPFRAVEIKHERNPGTWGTATVRIERDGVEIGNFERNYSSFGATSFESFEIDGRWFALYSSDYTATRVMSLPDCRDIGGEEPSSGGFCPVEIYAPRYRPFQISVGGEPCEAWHFESAAETMAGKPTQYMKVTGPWRNLNIAFVAGCVWGDDSSRKLQVIDLEQAAQGRILRDERFGHLEIASDLPLVAAIRLYRQAPEGLRATILRQEDRDIETGKRIDPYSDEPID
jgi:hypothetical protein